MADAKRSMDIAKERGMSLKQIISHDLISPSPLFDGDLQSHDNKSKLIGEIESRLDINKCSRESLLPLMSLWTSCLRWTDATCTIFHSGYCNQCCHQPSVKYM
ncbi:hypothetical protein DPMN_043955 [Dreissena polymorpha]|uniref:Uncharacterized protein n=1 Tax=Dreissena polymorpha TaxID=45954 RepID=A0A9D4D231_DREPO|nr:hypothetical protein DPMN_043955 [Dreissena polymorpha]